MTELPRGGPPSAPWALGAGGSWMFDHAGVRLLPAEAGRLEFARAVRAQIDAYEPDVIVVDIRETAANDWLEAIRALPRISALRLERRGRVSWRLIEPTDAIVEAARVGLAAGRPVVCGGLDDPDPTRSTRPRPDPAAMPAIGYEVFVALCAAGATTPATAPRNPGDEALLRAAERASSPSGAKVALVCGLERFARIWSRVAAGRHVEAAGLPAVVPFASRLGRSSAVLPVHVDALVEVMAEPPYVAACWERARRGEAACLFSPPAADRPRGSLVAFPGSRAVETQATATSDRQLEDADRRRGVDVLARQRLLARLIEHTVRMAREEGAGEPTTHERRTLQRFARNQALVAGRLCPDLYELIVAARGSVDDRFARDALRVAAHWPWDTQPAHGVRLRAADLGRSTRLVKLRPRIDRIARRPGLAGSWRRHAEGLIASISGICSHPPEDIVVEALGDDLRRLGRARSTRSGVQSVPFTASLLDGVDARQSLRRWIVDQRVWVREELASRGECDAVVVIFDEDDTPGTERFPWCEVWYGEHENESDLALYSTAPADRQVLPGIYRAEYGGLLMTWPPRRLGDVWRDPAYAALCRNKPERLLLAGLDYSRETIVTYVSRRPPREAMRAIARRLGRRIAHVPPGAISADRLRRIRRFHVLAGRELRPLAERLIDPP